MIKVGTHIQTFYYTGRGDLREKCRQFTGIKNVCFDGSIKIIIITVCLYEKGLCRTFEFPHLKVLIGVSNLHNYQVLIYN